MKRPHRWTALFAVLLMAMALAVTPREGVAGGGPYRPIDAVDPPMQDFGEPDVPPTRQYVYIWIGNITIAFRFNLDSAPRIAMRAATKCQVREKASITSRRQAKPE